MHITRRYNNTHWESWQWLMKNNRRWEWISSMKQNKPDAQRIARNVYSFSLFECPKIFMCFLHEVRLMENNGKAISTCLHISPPKPNWFQLKILLLIHYLLNYVFLSGIRSEIVNSDYWLCYGCLSSWNNSTSTRRIFVKCCIAKVTSVLPHGTTRPPPEEFSWNAVFRKSRLSFLMEKLDLHQKNFREMLCWKSHVCPSSWNTSTSTRRIFVKCCIGKVTSVLPHGTTRPPPEEFSWNAVLGNFSKVYRQIPILVKIGKTQQELFVKTSHRLSVWHKGKKSVAKQRIKETKVPVECSSVAKVRTKCLGRKNSSPERL
jgi:hypothetical protein